MSEECRNKKSIRARGKPCKNHRCKGPRGERKGITERSEVIPREKQKGHTKYGRGQTAPILKAPRNPHVNLEVQFEVVGNFVHEVYTVGTDNIVLVARIGEVVDLNVIDHALANEAEAMLPQHYGVEGSLADE